MENHNYSLILDVSKMLIRLGSKTAALHIYLIYHITNTYLQGWYDRLCCRYTLVLEKPHNVYVLKSTE